MKFSYPGIFLRHPRLRSFHSLRRTFHDQVAPFHDDPLVIFWGAGPCGTLLGTDTPTRNRKACQDLWPGFIWATGCDPLYIQPRAPRFEGESFTYLDLG